MGSSSSPHASTSEGLAFLALTGFLASFVIARIFTTVNPDIVVISSGIHFHHFWYGLIMICVAGWLGIASNRPEYDRAYALMFGLGLGLVGDEVGLLLTLGDYNSELTYVVFLAGLAFLSLVYLAYRNNATIKNEVFSLGKGERTAHIGIGIVAISFLAFAFGYVSLGVVGLTVGIALGVAGVWLHKTMADST